MNNSNIQIVRLGPMRIACARAFGMNPEKEAWEKLITWADTKGLLIKRNEHPIFGFKNCCQSLTDLAYGFEIWIKVGSDFVPDVEWRISEFPGGSFAVTRCSIPDYRDQRKIIAWSNLAQWCENNKIKPGNLQQLEKFVRVSDDFTNLILDLYYPIIY
jgi:DNA gyrase inhibitor GyrI